MESTGFPSKYVLPILPLFVITLRFRELSSKGEASGQITGLNGRMLARAASSSHCGLAPTIFKRVCRTLRHQRNQSP